MSSYEKKQPQGNSKALWAWVFVICLSVFLAACAEIQKTEPEPFYAETTPPAKQEFRWSNGKAPKSFDPARAAAAPETDIVRAVFEGLTDIDTRTLNEVPAVAEKWTSSPDFRVWTFQLRKDARWSNARRVTADDFVTSWKRFMTLEDKVAHSELFQNIVGMQTTKKSALLHDAVDLSHSPVFGEAIKKNEHTDSTSLAKEPDTTSKIPSSDSVSTDEKKSGVVQQPKPVKSGVEALDANTLRVTLETPDKDFPKLVANPVFRPIYGDGAGFENAPLDADVVTNGPFTVTNISKDSIGLERSDTYWNKSDVALDNVKFVFKESAEAALVAYKKGEIDALTNAEFEPLAVKILSPYDDFRQTTHSALNFYEFNTKNPPFNDRRVREALAVSIDRVRLTDGELERTALPATTFLPLAEKKGTQISFDVQKAKDLLTDAGFANGENFPKIRLLINRNDTQQRVARAVARMWKQNLNLDAEIIVEDISKIDAIRTLGEYDLVRRNVVLPTVDEAVGIAAIFGSFKKPEPQPSPDPTTKEKEGEVLNPLVRSSDEKAHSDLKPKLSTEFAMLDGITEEDALREFYAIPLYFPMAYSLIKPYVRGFEVNGIDATALEGISIDNSWQPKTVKGAP